MKKLTILLSALAASMAAHAESIVNIGDNVTATGAQSVAIGDNTKAESQFAVAVGTNAEATGDRALAIGDHSKASGETSLALIGGQATAKDAIAVGGRATAELTTTVGNSAVANQAYASAFGVQAKATGVASTAIGDGAQASGTYATAVGVGAKATNKNDVAVGGYSQTTAVTSVEEAQVGNLKYGNFAGTVPSSAYSVGQVGKERQVQNVAAGQITSDSTDAINGSQLYAVAQQVSTNADGISGNAQNIAANTVRIDAVEAVNAKQDVSIAQAQKTADNAQIAANNAQSTADTAHAEAKKHTTVKSNDNRITVSQQTGANGGAEYALSLNSVANQADLDRIGAQAQSNASGIVDLNQKTNSLQSAVKSNQNAISNLNKQVADNGKRIDALDSTVKRNDKKLRAGVAGATAVASIPQVYKDGKSLVGVGVGGYRGEHAIAVGASHASDNGKHVIKVNLGLDTRGNVNYGAGYGYQF